MIGQIVWSAVGILLPAYVLMETHVENSWIVTGLFLFSNVIGYAQARFTDPKW